MPRIYGETVMLREYQPEDLAAIRSWHSLPGPTATLASIFVRPHTVRDAEGFLEEMLKSPGAGWYFVIAQRETGDYIGQIDLRGGSLPNRHADLGMVIPDAANQGRGYGTEALGLLLQFAFCYAGLHRVGLEVYEFNHRAIHLYRKVGFRDEGRLRDYIYRDGAWHDTLLMGMLSSEFDCSSSGWISSGLQMQERA